jgi:hypothetical protein
MVQLDWKKSEATKRAKVRKEATRHPAFKPRHSILLWVLCPAFFQFFKTKKVENPDLNFVQYMVAIK